MTGPTRINLAGLLFSCVGNGVILGGLLYGLTPWSRPRLPSESSRPLVVELLPLDGRSAKSEGADKPVAAIAAEAAHKSDVKEIAPAPESPLMKIRFTTQPDVGETASGAVPATASVDASSAGRAAFGAELSDYQRRLNELIARNSRYPAEARRERSSGVTRLAFRLDRDGSVADSWIQESSGSELLDNAALDALERSKPLPPIPLSLPARLEFVVEIDSSMALASR